MTKIITPYEQSDAGKKQQVATMFNNISGNYDFLNHFLSFGIDKIWRRKAISSLKNLKPERILDVATGTGDFAIESIKRLEPRQVIGIDISEGMLEVAQEKIKRQKLDDVFGVELGDCENLRFKENSFDAVTVAFGVRNFEDLDQGLLNIHRVLRPGGQAVILEFSNPKKFPIKQLYSFYSRNILPAIGRLFSKDNRAYNYLPESIVQFPDGERFASCLKNAGFRKAVCRPQTFGICTIYIATK